MIRMIATDLDGTLLAGKSIIPEENIAALRRAMDAGVYVVLASGRMVEATVPIARQIDVNAPISVFNGGMVYDLKEEKPLAGVTIDRETARAILRVIEESGGYVHAFPSHGYYLSKPHEIWTKYYSDKINVFGTETGMPLSEWLSEDVYKLLALGTAGELKELQDKLVPMFPDVNFMKSGENHLEIVRKGVNKAFGLKTMGDILGIKPEEMLCFGDEMNDMPMLEYAGLSYVMENAPANVLAQAKGMRVAPANTQCGVAKVVNMLLDDGKMGG